MLLLTWRCIQITGSLDLPFITHSRQQFNMQAWVVLIICFVFSIHWEPYIDHYCGPIPSYRVSYESNQAEKKNQSGFNFVIEDYTNWNILSIFPVFKESRRAWKTTFMWYWHKQCGWLIYHTIFVVFYYYVPLLSITVPSLCSIKKPEIKYCYQRKSSHQHNET